MAQLGTPSTPSGSIRASQLSQAQIAALQAKGLYSPTATYNASYLNSLGVGGSGQTVNVGSQGQYPATTYSGNYVTNPYNQSSSMPAPYMDYYNSINQRLASGEITQAEANQMHQILSERIAGAQPGYPLTPVTPATAAGCGGAPGTAAGTCGGIGTGGIGGVGSLGTPTVTPAPAYQKSPEQLAWEETYSGYLTDILEQGGIGIPEATMNQMIQRQTDMLKAKETEDIRVMRNNMERRGITNSGFVYSNEQKIRSNTTTSIANSVTDLQIQNALMKMASFENALGMTGQYLGYLSEQSQLEYAPKLATWNAQQQANLVAYNAQVQAKLTEYQAQVDIYKMAIAQSYEQGNMGLAYYYESLYGQQQHSWDLEIAQMQLEMANQQSMYSGAGNIVGMLLGSLFGK